MFTRLKYVRGSISTFGYRVTVIRESWSAYSHETWYHNSNIDGPFGSSNWIRSDGKRASDGESRKLYKMIRDLRDKLDLKEIKEKFDEWDNNPPKDLIEL